MTSTIQLTDIQRRNLEILVFDALYHVKTKKHSLTEVEIIELLKIMELDHKNKVDWFDVSNDTKLLLSESSVTPLILVSGMIVTPHFL